MKVKLNKAKPKETLESLSEKYGLSLVVNERDNRTYLDSDKYYARFENVEVKEGICLHSVYGDGKTPVNAILDYAEKIQNKLLVKDAFQISRHEFEVDVLDLTALDFEFTES